MATIHAKRATRIVAGLVLTVVLAAAIADRRWWVEEYYIQRLASSDEKTQLGAAEALAEIKSKRAVPYLVPLLVHRAPPRVPWWDDKLDAWDVDAERAFFERRPFAYAIYRIGPGALPELRKLDSDCASSWDFQMLIHALTRPKNSPLP